MIEASRTPEYCGQELALMEWGSSMHLPERSLATTS